MAGRGVNARLSALALQFVICRSGIQRPERTEEMADAPRGAAAGAGYGFLEAALYSTNKDKLGPPVAVLLLAGK